MTVTDRRVAARQIIVKHLSMPNLLAAPFPERLDAIMSDLAAAGIIPPAPLVIPAPRPEPRLGLLLEGWGRQVRAARQGRGWTVRVLAARAGISPPTVLRIETDRPVRAPKIAAVLAALDLPEA